METGKYRYFLPEYNQRSTCTCFALMCVYVGLCVCVCTLVVLTSFETYRGVLTLHKRFCHYLCQLLGLVGNMYTNNCSVNDKVVISKTFYHKGSQSSIYTYIFTMSRPSLWRSFNCVTSYVYT